MFLAYLDSSGRPTFDDKENYVLTAIITNEISWQFIDNGVKQIKIKHFPGLPDTEVEIHAKDMMNREGIYNGLTWDKLYEILDDTFDFIQNDDTEICIINVLIDKSKLYRDKDAEIWAYRLIFERINKFIEKQNDKLILAQGGPQYGIMIIDSYGLKADQKLRTKVYEMLKHGTLYCNLEYLIEDPLFTDSKWRNLSQIADCVAYAVRKKHRSTAKPTFHDENWSKLYDKITKKFDTNDKGEIKGYGLKIFP